MYVNSPVVTTNDCEGGGETFNIEVNLSFSTTLSKCCKLTLN